MSEQKEIQSWQSTSMFVKASESNISYPTKQHFWKKLFIGLLLIISAKSEKKLCENHNNEVVLLSDAEVKQAQEVAKKFACSTSCSNNNAELDLPVTLFTSFADYFVQNIFNNHRNNIWEPLKKNMMEKPSWKSMLHPSKNEKYKNFLFVPKLDRSSNLAKIIEFDDKTGKYTSDTAKLDRVYARLKNIAIHRMPYDVYVDIPMSHHLVKEVLANHPEEMENLKSALLEFCIYNKLDYFTQKLLVDNVKVSHLGMLNLIYTACNENREDIWNFVFKNIVNFVQYMDKMDDEKIQIVQNNYYVFKKVLEKFNSNKENVPSAHQIILSILLPKHEAYSRLLWETKFYHRFKNLVNNVKDENIEMYLVFNNFHKLVVKAWNEPTSINSQNLQDDLLKIYLKLTEQNISIHSFIFVVQSYYNDFYSELKIQFNSPNDQKIFQKAKLYWELLLEFDRASDVKEVNIANILQITEAEILQQEMAHNQVLVGSKDIIFKKAESISTKIQKLTYGFVKKVLEVPVNENDYYENKGAESVQYTIVFLALTIILMLFRWGINNLSTMENNRAKALDESFNKKLKKIQKKQEIDEVTKEDLEKVRDQYKDFIGEYTAESSKIIKKLAEVKSTNNAEEIQALYNDFTESAAVLEKKIKGFISTLHSNTQIRKKVKEHFIENFKISFSILNANVKEKLISMLLVAKDSSVKISSDDRKFLSYIKELLQNRNVIENIDSDFLKTPEKLDIIYNKIVNQILKTQSHVSTGQSETANNKDAIELNLKCLEADFNVLFEESKLSMIPQLVNVAHPYFQKIASSQNKAKEGFINEAKTAITKKCNECQEKYQKQIQETTKNFLNKQQSQFLKEIQEQATKLEKKFLFNNQELIELGKQIKESLQNVKTSEKKTHEKLTENICNNLEQAKKIRENAQMNLVVYSKTGKKEEKIKPLAKLAYNEETQGEYKEHSLRSVHEYSSHGVMSTLLSSKLSVKKNLVSKVLSNQEFQKLKNDLVIENKKIAAIKNIQVEETAYFDTEGKDVWLNLGEEFIIKAKAAAMAMNYCIISEEKHKIEGKIKNINHYDIRSVLIKASNNQTNFDQIEFCNKLISAFANDFVEDINHDFAKELLSFIPESMSITQKLNWKELRAHSAITELVTNLDFAYQLINANANNSSPELNMIFEQAIKFIFIRAAHNLVAIRESKDIFFKWQRQSILEKLFNIEFDREFGFKNTPLIEIKNQTAHNNNNHFTKICSIVKDLHPEVMKFLLQSPSFKVYLPKTLSSTTTMELSPN